MKHLTIAAICGVLASMAVAADAVAIGGGGKLARGHTAQGKKILLQIDPHSVEIKSFSIELRCSGGYELIDQESDFVPSAVSHGGLVHDRQFGSTDEVLIRGRLTAHSLRGWIRVRDRLGKHRCSSPRVHFTAHR